MHSSKLREFLMIMEGEYIPNRPNTLRVDIDPYNLYRTLMRMPSAENYTEPNGNGLSGLLTFLDQGSYDEAKRKFDVFGIKYKEDDGKTNFLWDKEHKTDEFSVSPYPNNGAVGDNSKQWVDGKPTAKAKSSEPKKR